MATTRPPLASGNGNDSTAGEPRGTGRIAWAVAAAIPLAVGLIAALRSAWVCDDAFISFRYVDNLARGLGLVYNAGERVEGYTHFLWVILLAAVQRLSVDVVDAGRFLPVLFHAGTLAVLTLWSRRQWGDGAMFLPVAAWGVALHRDMQIWASGGLETAAFTFCVTAAMLSSSSARARPGVTAMLAALSALLRPEGMIVSAIAAGVLAWRQRSLGILVRYAAKWLALVAPLIVWRLVYYHDWVPNTFYAKSAQLANWEQGWRYVSSYFAAYPILVVALAAAIVEGGRNARRAGDATLACAVTSLVLLVYVLRVGGDFMFARFLVPITPLLYVALEAAIRRLHWRRGFAIAAAAIAVAATVAAPVTRARVLARGEGVRGIADEHAVYTRAFVETRRREGAAMAAMFHGTGVRVCALGSQAGFAYFAGFPYVFERYGLTDREFARRRIGLRGRPGHEREVSRRDLVARRVHLIFRGRAADAAGDPNEMIAGDLVASIVFYDRQLMDALEGRPGVTFVDYPAYLDDLVRRAETMTPEARRSAWITASEYYFMHNDDPERESRVRAALGVPR